MSKLMLLQTTTTAKNATLLTRNVLDSKLSPCIQHINLTSHYFWDGKIMQDDEVLLQFKVFKKDFKTLKKIILKHHSYVLPEIIGIKLYKVSKHYKQWCKDSVKHS